MELTINLPHGEQRVAMTGPAERNLKIIRETLGVKITARNGSLRISGETDAVGKAARVLERLAAAARRNRPMDRDQLLDAILAVGSETALPGSDDDVAVTGEPDEVENDSLDVDGRDPGFDVYVRSRRIRGQTPGQDTYLRAIRHHDLTFCSGPAGTGKTYLAVAAAVSMLKHGRARKLVLVRPAVEAGEKLGFLPGTMQDKVNPYLRPLFDALHDMMEFDQIQRMMACDVIEIVPLAFMRGRTLNDATIILDEAQNTTTQQMLMFLTRLGHGSRMIVTGDTSQIDLPDPSRCGLIDAARRLRRVPGVALVSLTPLDIVRHDLVQRIVDAYGSPTALSRDRGPASDVVTTGSIATTLAELPDSPDSRAALKSAPVGRE